MVQTDAIMAAPHQEATPAAFPEAPAVCTLRTPTKRVKHSSHEGLKLLEDEDMCSTAPPSTVTSPNLTMSDGAPYDADFHLDDAEEHNSACPKEWFEWYFSAESLCHDQWLRSRMDEFGWVQIDDIVRFAGLRSVNTNVDAVVVALKGSKCVEVSEDSCKLRARNPAVLAAFAPRTAEESRSALSPRPQSIEAGAAMRASKEGAPFPCLEWLTSDPLITEGCLEWFTSELEPHELLAEPQETTSCDIPKKLHSKRARRGRKKHGKGGMYPNQQFNGVEFLWMAMEADVEFSLASPKSPTSTAWTRFADDAYPCAAGSLLGW